MALNKTHEGVKVGREIINRIKYADDTALNLWYLSKRGNRKKLKVSESQVDGR